MRQKNIFYRLIKNETSLTEAFCNLLIYKPFRDMFLNMVNKINPQIIASKVAFKDFDTETTLQDNKGRSDLLLKTDNTEYIFEIKINRFTKLTDNQPIGYLQHLKKFRENDLNKRLFFIIPRGYLHLDEICRNWRSENGYTRNQIKENNILIWEDILEEIKNSELDKLNLFINEFRGIIESRWLKYVSIVFTKFEISLIFNKNKKKDNLKMPFDTNIPRVVRKLFQVVEEVYEKFEIDKSSDEQRSYCYGYSLLNSKYNIPKKLGIWFGVDFEIWEKHNFPLTIQISSDDDKELDRILKLKISEKFEYEDPEWGTTTFIGLGKKVFENPELNLVEELEKRIHETIEKIKIDS